MSSLKKKKNAKTNLDKEYESQLIAEIKKRPYLYDRTHEFYSEIQLRTDAWQAISEELNKSVNEVKKKWETLRDSYRRFHKKINHNLNEENSIKEWIHYENMEFLNGHIKIDHGLSSEQVEKQKKFDAKLISEVVKHKSLYDPMDEAFRNMKERAITWEEISKIMNSSVEVCKKRWNYSRDTFRKFHKKEIKDNKKINWIHYNSLKFLLKYDSANNSDLKPPHTYNPSKPKIPPELKILPLLNDISMKFENNILDEEVKLDCNLEYLEKQKCGEILITKTGIFSYKCCICNDNMGKIDNFVEHMLESHMGRNGNISIFKMHPNDNLENNETDDEDDYFNDITNNDDDSNEEKISDDETNNSTMKNVIKKLPLKYIKNEKRKKSLTEEDLKENSSDDLETATLKRIKRQNKLVKIKKIGKYPCNMCSFSFDKEENLHKHKEYHRKAIPYIFEQKKGRVFRCDECDRRFQYRHQLQKHKRLHTGERPYQCTICEQKFRHYDNLKEHYIFRHTEDRPYSCRHDGCDKKFKTIKTRTEHEALHSTDLPFQCDECGKCFPRNSYLKRHRNTWHMDKNDRPYKCPHCTKSFCTQQNLKYHIYTHTGERPFSCPNCPSKFTKPWTIKEHMKIHSGERNYVCLVCGAAFNQIAGLIKHKKRHERLIVSS